jgi:hypothetical protein
MKNLHSLPTDKAFFDNYAPLAKSVTAAGFFAQIVSALTEVGIIYTGCQQGFKPLHLGAAGVILSGAVALLATAVIEVGLRKTAPVAVDSILFRRWSGLHLPISISVWLLAVVLMATSGYLSFSNSSVIVDNFTPEAEQGTTTAADSTKNAATAYQASTFTADSTMIAAAYDTRTTATGTAFDGRIRAKDEALRSYESKEARTGKSYAGAKDKIRQDRANLEAEKAGQLADLASAKAVDLAEARKAYHQATTAAVADYKQTAAEVKAANATAEAERLATVTGYGSGLGLFTLICLLIFAVSVVLDRIYRKGAGISESVLIESYDFRPGALTEGLAAIRERVNQFLHSRITAFADRTPPAPLPPQPGAAYDLTEALQAVTIQLVLDHQLGDQNKVLRIAAKTPPAQLPPPGRKIGFHQATTGPVMQANTTGPVMQAATQPLNAVDPLYATNHQPPTTDHRPPTTTGTAYQDADLRHALQELKKYKKRVGSHQQKAIAEQRKTGKICRRTESAIQNNTGWVAHWEKVVGNLKSGKA